MLSELRLEQHRGELTRYCNRMLGSSFEAEDAVQETLVRAWRAFDRFEGRASVRSWLYRIATNVCFDMLSAPQRRARPMDLESPTPAEGPCAGEVRGATALRPVPDSHRTPAGDDPAEVAASHEEVRFAFVAALRLLPPRQRAVLILRDVLRWTADEVAELLGSTTASVNSALQRARSTLVDRAIAGAQSSELRDEAQQTLLARYVDAFERYEVASLVSLVCADAAPVGEPAYARPARPA